MKYFRVKTGYGKDDFISIDETEVETAIKAQITGKVAVLKEGTISGNNIISVTPDYQRIMGWNRDYQLTGEDYSQIGKKVQEEYALELDSKRRKVLGLDTNKSISEMAKGIAQKLAI